MKRKQKNITVYHGTVDDFYLNEKKPLSVTTDKTIAEDFARINWYQQKEFGNPFVSEFTLSKRANILQLNEIPKKYIDDVTKSVSDFEIKGHSLNRDLEIVMRRKQRALVDYAKRRGYDGVEIPSDEREIKIINFSVIKRRR